MATITTYICDVRSCQNQRGQGSRIELRIQSSPGWSCPATFDGDLCEKHLTELMTWMEQRELDFQAEV